MPCVLRGGYAVRQGPWARGHVGPWARGPRRGWRAAEPLLPPHATRSVVRGLRRACEVAEHHDVVSVLVLAVDRTAARDEPDLAPGEVALVDEIGRELALGYALTRSTLKVTVVAVLAGDLDGVARADLAEAPEDPPAPLG